MKKAANIFPLLLCLSFFYPCWAAEDTGRYRISIIIVRAQTEAKQVLEKLDAGEDFSELCKKYSIGPGKNEGGDVGFVTPGDLMKPLNSEVLRLKVGQYSKAIKTNRGYFILMKTEEKNGLEKKAGDKAIAQTRPTLSKERVVEAPISTPTETRVPAAIITGRVYLMDRNKPIVSTIKLSRGEPSMSPPAGTTGKRRMKYTKVDNKKTDENGHYSFIVEKSGIYTIELSVQKLLNLCDNLRMKTKGWVVTRSFDSKGQIDVGVMSLPISITSGDEKVLNIELYCD